MNNLQVFQFDSAQVRTVVKDGEPWFFAQDIAEVLGYSATSAMLKRLDDDEKVIDTFLEGTTYKKQSLISEPGLYNAVLGSQLDSSKKFKKWITSEVLPSIRKSGKYEVASSFTLPASFSDALKLAYEQQLQIEQSNALLLEMQPKAAFFDQVTESKTAIDMACAAKVLNMGIGRTKLFEFLRAEKILQQNNQPYQEFIDRGYFRVIESSFNKPDGSINVCFKTVVYQRGLDFISKRYRAFKEYREAA